MGGRQVVCRDLSGGKDWGYLQQRGLTRFLEKQEPGRVAAQKDWGHQLAIW